MTDKLLLGFIIRSVVPGSIAGAIYGFLFRWIASGELEFSPRNAIFGVFFGAVIGAVNGYVLQGVTGKYFLNPTPTVRYRLALGVTSILMAMILTIIALYLLMFAYSDAPLDSALIAFVVRLMWFPALTSFLASQYLAHWYIKISAAPDA